MSSSKEHTYAFRVPSSSLFDKALTKLVKQVETKAASTDSELDPDPIYYVYVLLDPRKPGAFEYTLPGSKLIAFKYQPFYVGKGKGDRLKTHVKSTRKRVARGRKLTHKENTIKKIESLGLKVIEKRISFDLPEAVSFAKEIMLISTIGRVDLGTGLLTNWSGGGEGVIDLSPETIRKHSESQKAVRAALTPKQNAKRNKLTSESVAAEWKARSPDAKKVHAQKTIAQMEALTDKERRQLTAPARKAYKKVLDSLTDEERNKLLGSGSKAWWASMTDEERESQNKKAGTALSKSLQARSPEAKAKHYNNQRNAQLARIANMTPEEREAERARKRAQLDALPIQQCPHCGYEGKGPNMKKYHFDRCKYKS
jgi:hypothetical protein